MNLKNTLLFAVVCALWGVSAMQAREVIPMNNDWRFALADSPAFGQPEFDDSGWRQLNLPHDWTIEGKYDKSDPSGPMGGYMPCGTGWYRKNFTVTQTDKGKRFFIQFDGVHMKSQVWINGRMVGEYPNGYNSFEYDEWNRGQEWGYSETSYGKLAYTYHLYFEQWSETDQRRILLGTETYNQTKNHVSIRDNASAIGEFVWVGFDYMGEIVWPDYRGWLRPRYLWTNK